MHIWWPRVLQTGTIAVHYRDVRCPINSSVLAKWIWPEACSQPQFSTEVLTSCMCMGCACNCIQHFMYGLGHEATAEVQMCHCQPQHILTNVHVTTTKKPAAHLFLPSPEQPGHVRTLVPTHRGRPPLRLAVTWTEQHHLSSSQPLLLNKPQKQHQIRRGAMS